jgi:hypothetical protein
MSYVFVLDHKKRPLDPVHPGRARFLLTAGHAAVWRRFPLTIILREVCAEPPPQRLRLKIDPGSKTTGLAVLSDATGSCNLTTASGTIEGIHYRYCRCLHRTDGYSYQKGAALPPQAQWPGLRAGYVDEDHFALAERHRNHLRTGTGRPAGSGYA